MLSPLCTPNKKKWAVKDGEIQLYTDKIYDEFNQCMLQVQVMTLQQQKLEADFRSSIQFVDKAV